MGAEERCKVDHFEDVYFREESRDGEEEEEKRLKIEFTALSGYAAHFLVAPTC